MSNPEEQTPQAPSGMNPNASSFEFNISAGEFVPSFGAPPPVQQSYPMYYPDQQYQPNANMYYNQGYQGYPDQFQYQQYQYGMQPNYYYPEGQMPEEEPEEPKDDTMSFSEFESMLAGKTKSADGPKLGFKSVNVGGDIKKVAIQEDAPQEEVKVVQKVRKPVIRTITEKQIDKEMLISKLREVPVNEEQPLIEPDATKEPVNIVFIGHVDSGKSTICGNILLISGKVDQRLIDTYEAEAKENGRDSWWLAYIMDQNEEERQKGITVEVGKANFETKSKRFSILDAPGHKAYVPNMIGGASQADYAALVISARISEFETGFDRGGQTREHAMLAKSLGVNNLVVVINKMDDPSVNWSQDRFDQIKREMSPFLADKCKYDLATQVSWIPISGISGANIIERVNPEVAPWFEGPTLFEIFDTLPIPNRSNTAPLRIPILDRSKDQGLIIYGKVESGQAVKGLRVIIMPIRVKGEIIEIIGAEESRLMYANAGENVRIKLKVAEEVEIQRGFVICDVHDVCHTAQEFCADVQLLDLLEEKQIMSAGYQCVMHAHTAIEECEVLEITAVIDVQKKKKTKTSFGRSNQRILMKVKTEDEICVEPFAKMHQLGRFTLRDEGKTIGLGKITEIVEEVEVQDEEPANK